MPQTFVAVVDFSAAAASNSVTNSAYLNGDPATLTSHVVGVPLSEAPRNSYVYSVDNGYASPLGIFVGGAKSTVGAWVNLGTGDWLIADLMLVKADASVLDDILRIIKQYATNPREIPPALLEH
ncbi:hypothetical protein HC928_00620 [bacterium]|nr:hypothetical protein [bacterium]